MSAATTGPITGRISSRRSSKVGLYGAGGLGSFAGPLLDPEFGRSVLFEGGFNYGAPVFEEFTLAWLGVGPSLCGDGLRIPRLMTTIGGGFEAWTKIPPYLACCYFR